jgi:putative PIN family toxin of toxin-antitoxin system
MRLVLDTNIWLDWLIFDDPQIAPLRAAHAAGQVEIHIDAPCEDELRRVLAYRLRKIILDTNAQAAALTACRQAAIVLVPPVPDAAASVPELPPCRDADDQKFLELARAARADYLLTKDRALLDLGRRKCSWIGFRILTPQDFNQHLARDAPA